MINLLIQLVFVLVFNQNVILFKPNCVKLLVTKSKTSPPGLCPIVEFAVQTSHLYSNIKQDDIQLLYVVFQNKMT